jgi:hypothetical protein
MLLYQHEQSIAWCYLTETELRQLYRRFGHPSVQRLLTLLTQAGHEIKAGALEYLTKYCHQYQIIQKSPDRFKFTLRNSQNYNFNYKIMIDVLWIDSKPVL